MTTLDFLTETRTKKVATISNFSIEIAEIQHGDRKGTFHVHLEKNWLDEADDHFHIMIRSDTTSPGIRKEVDYSKDFNFSISGIETEAEATRLASALVDLVRINLPE